MQLFLAGRQHRRAHSHTFCLGQRLQNPVPVLLLLIEAAGKLIDPGFLRVFFPKCLQTLLYLLNPGIGAGFQGQSRIIFRHLHPVFQIVLILKTFFIFLGRLFVKPFHLRRPCLRLKGMVGRIGLSCLHAEAYPAGSQQEDHQTCQQLSVDFHPSFPPQT